MASHPHRYPELASYRDPTQLANRKWPPVYLFDIQARMVYAIKIFHPLPWVPETFLARFPVFVVASAYDQRCVSVRSTPKIPTAWQKNPGQCQVLWPYGEGLWISRTRTDRRKDDRKWKKFPVEVPKLVRLLQPRRMQPLSEKCKCANVCKSCQGDHSAANCLLFTRSSLSVSNWRLAWPFTYLPGPWFCKRIITRH